MGALIISLLGAVLYHHLMFFCYYFTSYEPKKLSMCKQADACLGMPYVRREAELVVDKSIQRWYNICADIMSKE